MNGFLPRLGWRSLGLVAALSLATAILLATCGSARAGWYDVVACSTAAGGAQNAFRAAADPGMAAYNGCPNTPSNPASGIVTRASATAGAGHVPMLAGAYQIFEVPSGAGLASVTFDLAAIRLSSHWTTGVVAWNHDFNSGFLPYGCYAGSVGCGIGSQSFFGPVTVGLGGHARFRFETRCGNPGGCDISASGFQPGMRALFAAANVVVTVHDFSAPSISPAHGALFGDGWHRGREEAWQSLGDNVGVMLSRLYADGRLIQSQDYRDAGWPAHLRCDFTRSRPCSDVTSGLSLDTRTLSDGAHAVRIEAVDAAGNASHLDRTIQVDNTAPPPVGAQVEGGEQWRPNNDFAVRWTPPSATGAPISAVHHRLCPVDGASGCSDGSRAGESLDRLDGLRLPRTGEYTVRLWLEDAAGNSEPANAAPPVVLRYDGAAPDAAFLPLDDRDPLSVEARLSDEGSGVAAGAIEIRRAGFRQWHELETTVQSERLRARVDDLQIPDGVYEARAIVRDHAGNERTTGRTEGGRQMELRLPLRHASRLRVSTLRPCRRARSRGRARRCHTRPTGSEAVPLVRPGARVDGVLTTDAGQPIERARVAVHEEPRTGGGFRRVATLATDLHGRFAHRVGSGASRVLRFRYDGAPLVKPATSHARVHVAARTTIKTSARRLRNGNTVVFSGRLTAGPVPDGGKLIDLQAHYRRSWRTFATPRSDRQGRWRFAYKFEATRGLVRYRFRARIRREAAYPYELGYSRAISVTVSGP